MSLLPFPEGHRIDPLARLAQRSRRLGQVVEASSARRDVRRLRAQLVLLVLQLSCPRSVRPRRSWYVAGACARLGVEGLRRTWEPFYGEAPPSERTLRRHLAELERLLVLVRGPGDWIPLLHHRPEVRPRYADTLHLVETEDEARWWSTEGRELLELHPRARTNPDVWHEHLAGWRTLAARRAPRDLFELARWEQRRREAPGGGAPQALGELLGAVPESETGMRARTGRSTLGAVLELAGAIAARAGPHELVARLRVAGAEVQGENRRRLLAGSEGRLLGAAALWTLAVRRGDPMSNPAGWLVRAWQRAPAEELAAALWAVDHRRAPPRRRGRVS